MSFKQFVEEKINYYVSHFKVKAVLLQQNGEPLREINLSFDHLSDEYMAKVEEQEKPEVQMENSTMKLSAMSEGLIKITDSDLDSFWDNMSSTYGLSFNIEGQNLTDKVNPHSCRLS